MSFKKNHPDAEYITCEVEMKRKHPDSVCRDGRDSALRKPKMQDTAALKPQSFIFLIISFCVFHLCGGIPAFCLPEIDKVISGKIECSYPDTSTLHITAVDKTIVNYKSFDILQNETVNITLPNADNSILN